MAQVRRQIEQLGFRNLDLHFIEFPEHILDGSAKMNDLLHFSNAAIFRIFAASVLDHQIDSIIYLDGDLFIRKAIDETTFPDEVFSAFIENNPSKEAISTEKYFNSGVFCSKISFWRTENVQEQLLQFLKDNPNSIYKDQDALNAVFALKNDYPLSENVNFIVQDYSRKEIKWHNPTIVHFAGPLKPWIFSTPNNKYVREWRKFAKSHGVETYRTQNLKLLFKRVAIIFHIHKLFRKLRDFAFEI
jgi:lipopolysaccharide biosynthesis glycosyltransferase